MADVFNSKHTSAEIEDILDSAGLVSTAEDETYSVKIVDSAGTLLLGIKLTGELDVPIGITDDAYNLIKAVYDKLKDVYPTIKNYCDSTFESSEARKALIDDVEDDNYVAKLIDASGNLLQGFKLNGEIDTPKGLTDDAYTLIEAVYKKMADIFPAIKGYCERTFESSDVRKALIDNTEDETHVMKMIDANGDLLGGFKLNGEMDTPKGLSDGAYTLLETVYKKMTDMAAIITELKAKIDELSK